MKKRKYIYLVSMKGYEWNDPIESFDDRKNAEEKARNLNANKKAKGFESMSEYVVTKILHND